MGLIEINYCVMPDLIRHPEYLYPSILDSGFRRNDKSLRDNGNFSSPKGEGFQPSPKGTLIEQIKPLLGYRLCALLFVTLGLYLTKC